MREIKFRAWEKENKIMWFDVAVGNGKILETIDIDSNPELVEDMFIIMQFTGLHDKNGKEIYEGDIVDNEGVTQEVVFGKIGYDGKWNGLTGFAFKEKTEEDDDGCEFYELDFIDDPRCLEVIGNIYENPNLLTKTK